MGKLMVAEGLGATVLTDFSVSAMFVRSAETYARETTERTGDTGGPEAEPGTAA